MRSRSAAGVFAAILALGATGPASAADGRREINQACALLGGCFPGDDAGFPVTIAATGSYLLTGDLSVATAAQAIVLLASPQDVEIDLNGFQIVGPVSCTGSGPSLSCEPVTGGPGITGGARVAVRNGRVSGFGGGGVAVTDWARIEDVVADGNADRGIRVGASSLVSRCIASRNLTDGISAGAASVVEHSIGASNGGRGILGTAAGFVVVESVATGNGSDGIGTSLGALVSGSSAYYNALAGIAVAAGSAALDNSVQFNLGNGIYAIEAGSTLNRNVARNNLGYGLFLTPGNSSYRENTLTGNGTGSDLSVAGGVNMGANFCNTDPCP
jgi:hypothetical protein